MSSGFEAIPRDLRRSADGIRQAIGSATRLDLHEPTGDYGFQRFQILCSAFIQTLGRHVEDLSAAANGHAARLDDSAAAYYESDDTSATELAKAGGVPSAPEVTVPTRHTEHGQVDSRSVGSGIVRRLNPGPIADGSEVEHEGMSH